MNKLKLVFTCVFMRKRVIEKYKNLISIRISSGKPSFFEINIKSSSIKRSFFTI